MAAQPTLSQHLNSQAKEVVFNVRQYFQQEMENGSILEAISKVNRRTAAATRVSERTVEKINIGDTS